MRMLWRRVCNCSDAPRGWARGQVAFCGFGSVPPRMHAQSTVCCVQQLPCTSVRVCVRACLGACTLHSASPWGPPFVAAATPACVEAGLACALACMLVCSCGRACVCACVRILCAAGACVRAPPAHERAPLHACTLQPGSPWSAACTWLQHSCACESLARVHASASRA